MSGDRWFAETLHDDVQLTFRASTVLVEADSAHQRLALFKNATFGDVLMLDEVTQTTTRDEFIYHEMMAHVPLLAHGAARSVLIIGGGDGGLAREVLGHATVERVTLVELDAEMILFAEQHLRPIHQGAFDDPRLEVVIADGCTFASGTERRFDVVLVDSTDPVGPGEVLFRKAFYRDVARILNDGGVVVSQNGVPFLQPDELRRAVANLRGALPDATAYLIAVPSYFGGHMALGYAGKPAPMPSAATLANRFAAAGISTRYYTPAVHQAAFALPGFIAALVDTA